LQATQHGTSGRRLEKICPQVAIVTKLHQTGNGECCRCHVAVAGRASPVQDLDSGTGPAPCPARAGLRTFKEHFMTFPTSVRTFSNHIGGRSTPDSSEHFFTTINPTNGQVWGRFVESGEAAVNAGVDAAVAAFKGPWSKLSPTARGRLLMAWGDRIAENAEALASLEVAQNGKLLTEMLAQGRAAKDWLYYYGGLADKVEGRVIPLERQTVLNYTLREPLGVVGVIVPWNSPTFITVMNCAPALAAGNTVVIKPSELTPASALELAKLADEAGIPPGVVNVITGGRAAGEALVRHERVAKIAFTGSEAGGRAIAAEAGRRLIKCSLELGGKSPNIVFADAAIDKAVVGLLAGIFAAAGQTCIAGSRAYIHEAVYDEVVERLVGRARAIQLGDPMLPATQMGPVASEVQLQKDLTMVREAREQGAELLHGGSHVSVEALRVAISLSQPFFTKYPKITPSCGKRCSGLYSASCASAKTTKWRRWQTTAGSGCQPASGPRICNGRTCSLNSCKLARCGSTPIALLPSIRHSAATRPAASVA